MATTLKKLANKYIGKKEVVTISKIVEQSREILINRKIKLHTNPLVEEN